MRESEKGIQSTALEHARGIKKRFAKAVTDKSVYPSVVFRILCHFFILCKREMTHDQTNIRHGSRTASSA